MPEATHPYSSSGTGSIARLVNQLRRSFPSTVNVETIQKLDMAPGSENKLVAILRFVGLIGDEGKRTSRAAALFSQHEDAAFAQGFAELVKEAYVDLFALHGDGAWTLNTNQLISFFRKSDETSAITGARQAQTFHALAALGGKAPPPPAREVSTTRTPRVASVVRKAASGKVATASAKGEAAAPSPAASASSAAAGTPAAHASRFPSIHIDVQVHISPETTPEQIDRIFESMSKHLSQFSK